MTRVFFLSLLLSSSCRHPGSEAPLTKPGDTGEPSSDSDADTDVDADTDTDSDTDADADADSGDTGVAEVDADGDGYPSTVDCDDSDPAIHPGAEELCDSIDNDCDGVNDIESCPQIGSLSYEGSASGDLLGPDEVAIQIPGGPTRGFGDTNGDGMQELWTSQIGIYWEEPATGTGGAHVWGWMSVAGERYLPDTTVDVAIEDTHNTYFGYSVDTSQDYNADGYDDILVGARHDSTGGTQSGAVYIFPGPLSGTVDSSTAHLKVYHDAYLGFFGEEVLWLGDENGDGTSEFAAASRYDDSACADCGAVYLLPGGLSGTLALDSAYVARLDGAPHDESEPYGGVRALAAGNLDGDGLPDLVVGAWLAMSSTGVSAGATYIRFGSSLTAF